MISQPVSSESPLSRIWMQSGSTSSVRSYLLDKGFCTVCSPVVYCQLLQKSRRLASHERLRQQTLSGPEIVAIAALPLLMAEQKLVPGAQALLLFSSLMLAYLEEAEVEKESQHE